ncbi:uncharacterized protein An03g06030 [Aspergillus niger]|uniref:Contig An03c0180, genomic contig n=2 Tax=Aspergillus niger TaxID=5061 RepID=A2QH92_ASPNC|nr:uncharacterized protein An03g06030 [Aspergillus niger]CAK38362.1 unnamed protein product [Aspergillus niger]
MTIRHVEIIPHAKRADAKGVEAGSDLSTMAMNVSRRVEKLTDGLSRPTRQDSTSMRHKFTDRDPPKVQGARGDGGNVNGRNCPNTQRSGLRISYFGPFHINIGDEQNFLNIHYPPPCSGLQKDLEVLGTTLATWSASQHV